MSQKMKYLFLIAILIGLLWPGSVFARDARDDSEIVARPFADPYTDFKTHTVGKAWLTLTNFGFFGNQGDERYPSFEFPGGSNTEYLFQGAVWVGALVQGQAFVSVGAEGWAGGEEFFPGDTPDDSINVLSIRDGDPGAISEQDFLCEYTDELTTLSDPTHEPLGLNIKQQSYAWSYSYAEDFIMIDYTITNIRTDNKQIENMYVGLYIDADVGHTSLSGSVYAQDDITGFRDLSINPVTGDTFRVESAWIADNDGDFNLANPAPGVSGTRVVFPPLDDLSFNWWISDESAEKDYGPAWTGEFPYGIWQEPFGTPDNDEQKYYLMSNASRQANPELKFDFDQELSDEVPSGWVGPPSSIATDIADGEDTRYLFSFGPVGNLDPADGIYKLAPGDSAKLTIGYFAAENFHRLGQDEHDYTDFDLNARWVKDVYDNPSRDTDGDGFAGEDVGCDGIWPGHPDYTGPDPDGTEGNNTLDPCEDTLGDPDRVGYNNGRLEKGDGVPDFDGPPPPLAPESLNSKGLGIRQFTKDGQLWVQLRWGTNAVYSEDVFANTDPLRLAKGSTTHDHPFFDRYPFLRGSPTDFEGFRVYKSRTEIVDDFELLAEFDLVDHDYAEYLVDEGVIAPEDLPKYDLGYDQGFDTKVNAAGDTIFTTIGDSIFVYNYGPVAPNWPIYFAVTAFDHGIPAANVQSLESSPNSNKIIIWPSPDPGNLSESDDPMVIPNPYRIDQDYTNNSIKYRWDDWNNSGFSEHTRRIDFVNLPAECIIRIYTLAGDLVDTVEHHADDSGIETSRESWGMITRNGQSLASGVYLFSVENLQTGDEFIGKFVVIR